MGASMDILGSGWLSPGRLSPPFGYVSSSEYAQGTSQTRSVACRVVGLGTLLGVAGCAEKPGYNPAGDVNVWLAIAIMVMVAGVLFAAIIWFVRSLDARPAPEVSEKYPWWRFRSSPKNASLDVLYIMMKSRDAALRAEAALEISRRLPSMTSEEYRSYDLPMRQRMYASLRGEDVEVALAMLDLFQRFEDQAALPYVERLLTEAEGKNSVSRLAKKTRECAERLRSAVQASGARLLRASALEPDLLRPAASHDNEDEALLLRPTGNESD
jgi:hypothetical protein